LIDALAILQRTDRASGVLTRVDLTTQAEQVLAESATDCEPVIVAALSVEGVRRLDDSGEWDLRDWVMRQIGIQTRRKLRSDDLVGRFSDDRFVVVLRRLDIALGQLIANKLMAAVAEEMTSQPVVHETISLRCGLTAAGRDRFDTALVRAFDALRLAREENRHIAVSEATDGSKRQPTEAAG